MWFWISLRNVFNFEMRSRSMLAHVVSANFCQKLPILRDQTCLVPSTKKFDVQYSYQLTFSTLIALLIHFHIDSVVFSAIPLDKGDLDQTDLKSRFQSMVRP